MRPEAQHYIMKVMTRWLQNKWWPGEKSSHGTCTNSKELKLFILILKVELLLSSHHDEYFYHLQRFWFSASILVVILFFFWVSRIFNNIPPSHWRSYDIIHPHLSKDKISNSFVPDKCVIYYFKQLIHGLGIHV